MSVFQISLVAIVWFCLAGVAYLVWLWLHAAQETRRRAFAEDDEALATIPPTQLEEMWFVRRWLFLAGYRHPNAATWFMLITLATSMLGVLLTAVFFLSGLYRLMVISTDAVPGGVGEVFLPAVWMSPWIVLLGLAALPALAVHRARRQRVELVEQDLPLTLELLATLSEAGLGFDAALARLQSTRLAIRPLATEFRSFQADLLSGRPRIHALRRLSNRLQIPPISIFVSALVQAEQLGMGIAQVLRRQADDMRDRRRERANAFAMSLTVKRVIPLVVCFLPGLFVWTLGPFFVQLFQLADSFTRVRGLGP
ncbi:Bacterial type II secretion system protein F domain protein [Anatilimnocola aggregata]|uniref:Bacterial type II secretion system protein F domain protein n=1 Tax=Anatilimnocola aggregata TaxID=2528021 RepID=A0A517Y9X0_9BACT|nr:type II secretion system F family protein [Anatilimnocola aggregata]QDU27033.1 Bacterial type II secretion system protein F domain protein [Anatilimnocola aggregata]